jgi:hypothetical protein
MKARANTSDESIQGTHAQIRYTTHNRALKYRITYIQTHKGAIVQNHNKPYINTYILYIKEHGRRNKQIAWVKSGRTFSNNDDMQY